ncbi:hypothetical protein [Roseateles sp. L2-2]
MFHPSIDRYFTPQTTHSSLAVSGGGFLAATTLVPGTSRMTWHPNAVRQV